jgi:hypothetical protein
MDISYFTSNQLHKASDNGYISIHNCHFIDGNAIIFLDNALVRKLHVDEFTVFEQSLTSEGDILLKKMN